MPSKVNRMLPRLHLPVRHPNDVTSFLGSPEQYVDGRSATLVAESWFGANDLPPQVRVVLDQSRIFKGAELVDAFMEKCIELGAGLRPSQADVLAIVGIGNELAIVAVEGKVDESFGPFVSSWLADAPSQKPLRLARLRRTLNLSASEVGDLRYQLLHRTASAVYEAIRYRAKHAAMVVHSFDPGNAGLTDFLSFADAMKVPGAGVNKLTGPTKCAGVDLYLGWVADQPITTGATKQ